MIKWWNDTEIYIYILCVYICAMCTCRYSTFLVGACVACAFTLHKLNYMTDSLVFE